MLELLLGVSPADVDKKRALARKSSLSITRANVLGKLSKDRKLFYRSDTVKSRVKKVISLDPLLSLHEHNERDRSA